MNKRNYILIITSVVVILIAAGMIYMWKQGLWKEGPLLKNKFSTYSECIAYSGVPCRFYFVGDFGHEWRPSTFKTKEECDAATIPVGATCIVPFGNFKETRWIFSSDLATAERENVNLTSTPTSQDGTANWKTYINTDYGFQLTLTDAWEGYYVKKHSGLAYYGDGTKTVDNVLLDFIIPTSDTVCNNSPGKFSILPLSVFSKDSWQKYNSDPIGAKRVIGQSNSYVFAYTSPQCYPSDVDPKIGEFAIDKVLSSFKLTR